LFSAFHDRGNAIEQFMFYVVVNAGVAGNKAVWKFSWVLQFCRSFSNYVFIQGKAKGRGPPFATYRQV
jgi:hypothetical protein